MSAAQSREYHFIGPRGGPVSQRTPGPQRYNHSAPPKAAWTEYSTPSGQKKQAQILGAGNTPKGGRTVPLIKPKPSRAIRPQSHSEWSQNYKRLQAAAKLAKLLRKANPYMNALDIGFQLLGAWSAWGPQAEETPAALQFPSTYDIYDCCDLGPPYTHVTSQPVGSSAGPYCSSSSFNQCGLGNQAVTNPVATGEALDLSLGQSQAIRYWEQQETPVGRYTLKKIQQVIKPRVTASIPFAPAIPGKVTVQPSPASPIPDPAAVTEKSAPPRNTHRPAPIVTGFIKPEAANPNRPSEIPANTIEVEPGGVYIPPQKPHVLSPPVPGQKELKIKTNAGSPFTKALSDLYNGVTEAGDFMEVLADSIEGNPCKGLKLAARTTCIGRNLHKVNLDAFMEGLIANHIEDQLMGTFLSWGKKSPYGVHTPTTAPSRKPPGFSRPRVWKPNV